MRTLTGLSAPRRPMVSKAGEEEARPCVEAGVARYATYRRGGMRDPPSAQQAATNKSLARSNKSRTGAKATKKRVVRARLVAGQIISEKT
jgi:hypothetical protein